MSTHIDIRAWINQLEQTDERIKYLQTLHADELKQLVEYRKGVMEYIHAVLFKDKAPEEGKVSKLVDGVEIVASYGLDRKVDMTSWQSVAGSPAWKELPGNVIRWRPELEVKVYRGLKKSEQKLVDQALVVTPKPVTLTFK